MRKLINFSRMMEPIVPTSTEFYCKDNGKQCNTDMYDLLDSESPFPILRRGCTFSFAIRFDREYVPHQDVVRVRFAIGPKPNVVKGTRVILPVQPKQKRLPNDPNRWSICLDKVDDTIIMLRVHISAYAPVGIWKCSLQTNIAGQKEKRVDYEIPEDIYIIFNPWCPQDGVYMENEEERNEYVLNETGKIWCGTFKNPSGKHWVFGQFDDIVLPAAMLLMEKSGLQYEDRQSPVYVTRAISALINSVDDDGLLEGRWDGQYEDGTSPFAWTGSPGIMDEFLRSGGKSVKYGQCWVFSGATVTVCRALGIPCRSTTNYVSAHDTNKSMTVDKYFDIFGNKIEESDEIDCRDSCWNFHVWNDVWLTRPDLPPGYGGWQIIDATPQETSDKVFRCGPSSVAAVKKGQVGFLYDTPFVFSEVNADIVHFKEDEASDWGFSRMSINKYHVGRKIVTKQVGITDSEGDSDIWDVTDLYKNPENTPAERLAVYNAVRGIPIAKEFYEIRGSDEENDVFFDLIDIDTVPLGQDFDVVVKIVNKSNEERTISAVLTAASVLYTGSAAGDIKKSQGVFKIAGGKEDTLQMRVTSAEYLDKLVDHGLIKIYATAAVEETKQAWSEEDDFSMILPVLTISMPETCTVNQPCEVKFRFKNPLNVPLTNCSYTVEGPGLQKPKIVEHRNVDPNEEVEFGLSFTAKKTGEKRLVVCFNCKEIKNLTASKIVKIGT
ncbi:hemocyte protein-glutamine gamma-glutamyltransferase-like isoform X2 [Euwallacea fornicatus]|uniref:hemocyte protein-glutamine gamma-glutamyltransferase-like isoform X2 n=1 Tax=Euwallacea fornicatus TaxID=995702 RepID=UPI00338F5EAE